MRRNLGTDQAIPHVVNVTFSGYLLVKKKVKPIERHWLRVRRLGGNKGYIHSSYQCLHVADPCWGVLEILGYDIPGFHVGLRLANTPEPRREPRTRGARLSLE